MKAQEKRLRILGVIDRLQGDSASSVPDTSIAEEVNLSVEEVQGHLEILEEEGRVMLSTSFEGSSGFLNPKQRQRLREELESQPDEPDLQVTAYDLYDPSMVRTLTGMIALAGNIQWQLFGNAPADQCEGVRVQFPLSGRIERRRALQIVQDRLQQNGIDLLQRRGQVWWLNLDHLREAIPDLLAGLEWATGTAVVEPEIEIIPSGIGVPGERTSVRFNVYKEEYLLERQQKIFLSHKGADKPLVRRFFHTLKAFGFAPWLDEDAMAAGTELERGILQGFRDSCAAVFFITPNYKDEGYLRTEVNYAVAEKRSKDARFAIITMVLQDEAGHKGTVPELLRPFVWKEPATELEAMNEIVRALPLEPGEPRWKV